MKYTVMILMLSALFGVAACNGDGSSGADADTSSAATAGSSDYSTAYKALSWDAAASVSYSGNCSMSILTTGVPPYHAAYYLAPVSTEYPTAVAETPVSKTEMSLVPYMASSITSSTATINICPSKASSTTSANAGVIGFMLSGEALFNPYEANGEDTPAMSDNVAARQRSSGHSRRE